MTNAMRRLPFFRRRAAGPSQGPAQQSPVDTAELIPSLWGDFQDVQGDVKDGSILSWSDADSRGSLLSDVTYRQRVNDVITRPGRTEEPTSKENLTEPDSGTRAGAGAPAIWPVVTTLCSIVKDEASYLWEWVSYHRMLGIQHFVFYDNESTDGTTDILLRLQNMGIATRIPWITPTSGSPQLTAYSDFINAHSWMSDFAGFLDVDEFLALPDGFDSIHAYFDANGLAHPSVSAVAVNQRVFGSSGKLNHEDGYVIERFRRSSAEHYPENRWCKSFFRPCRVIGVGNPHTVCVVNGRYVDSVGNDLDQSSLSSGQTIGISEGLRVNHYIIKSLSEFRRKQARGGAASIAPEDRMARYSDDFFYGRDRHINQVEWHFPEEIIDKVRKTHNLLSEG